MVNSKVMKAMISRGSDTSSASLPTSPTSSSGSVHSWPRVSKTKTTAKIEHQIKGKAKTQAQAQASPAAPALVQLLPKVPSLPRRLCGDSLRWPLQEQKDCCDPWAAVLLCCLHK